MRSIGILGEKGKKEVSHILRRKLNEYEKKVLIMGKEKESADDWILKMAHIYDYSIMEISREDLLNKTIKENFFDIIIHTNFEDKGEAIDEIQGLMASIKKGGYIIFNSDSIKNINFTCDKIYPITYGFNGRTTVTASSIDDMDGLSFSYCLQRAILTVNGDTINPFEKPFKFTGKHDDIYYFLTALTCLCVLGYKI